MRSVTTFFDFRAWRERMGGLTQGQAAELLGLAGRDSLTQIETARRSPSQTLVRLAEALERLREVEDDSPR